MSGLAAALAGRVPAGAYRWHAAYDAEQVRHTVEHAGWRYAHLDGWSVGSKSELLDALGPALGLEGFHGRNLDALEECVRELPGRTVLLWDGWGQLARADARTFAVVVDILTETDDRAGTWVLLRGEGPDLEVAALD